MPSKWKKVLDFKNGGSIYATTTNFIPVGISYERAKQELQTIEDQNLALFILATWN